MSAPTDVPFAPADADEAMSPEAVLQMERRLLDAFSQHHHHGGWIRRSSARWIGMAAALSILAGAGAAWRMVRLDHPHPGVVTEAQRALPQPARNVAPVSATPRVVDAIAGAHAADASLGTAPASARPAVRSRRPQPAVKPAAFIALPGAASLPTFESGAIVRMDLELSALAAYGLDISAAAGRSPVQADVLVGQDGEPRAIRVVTISSKSSSSSRSRQ
jgi:hypothetical protein